MTTYEQIGGEDGPLHVRRENRSNKLYMAQLLRFQYARSKQLHFTLDFSSFRIFGNFFKPDLDSI